MKKVLSIALALIMLFSFAACGAKETQEATTFVDELPDKGKILIGMSPDYPPYEYYDEAGNIVGFDAESAEAIIKILNAQNGTDITYELKPMDFSTIVSAVQTKQVDVGMSCFTYDPDRDVLFTDYYLKSAQVAVVAIDSDIWTIDDLKGKNIGAGTGTTGEAAAMEIEGVNVTCPGDYIQQFTVLQNHGLDAIACDEAVGLSYEATGNFRVLEERLVDEEVSAIVDKSNPLLCEALNKAIAEYIASQEYQDLKVKYGLN